MHSPAICIFQLFFTTFAWEKMYKNIASYFIMRIHKEGRLIIAVSAIVFLIINSLLFYFVEKSLLPYVVGVTSVILFFIVLNFFREPKRIFPTPGDNNVVAAPADGTIVVIEEVMETEYFHEKRMQVSIFMSVFNAHINWIPANGKIIHISYHPGRFISAYLPKSSSDNEHSRIIIETVSGDKILVKQIAGAVARRVVTYSKAGDLCNINQQLGFIKFGSRVDLLLPLHSEILVKMDQSVKGNQTIIARLNKTGI